MLFSTICLFCVAYIGEQMTKQEEVTTQNNDGGGVIPAAKSSQRRKVLIVYASQTGQAQAIAESLSDMAPSRGYTPRLCCISKADKEFKLNELDVDEPLVLVCSTTGDGEVPESAVRAYNKLRRMDTAANRAFLGKLRYALLGLGDTNYTQFANGPKLFHKRLRELGAQCVHGPCYADDGTGLEIVVEPFKKDVWASLDKLYADEESKSTTPPAVVDEAELEKQKLSENLNGLTLEWTVPELSVKHFALECYGEAEVDEDEADWHQLAALMHDPLGNGLLKATVVANRVVTGDESLKRCHELTFTSDVPLAYEPGHSIDVVCHNSPSEVDALLRRLRVPESQWHKRLTLKSTDPTKKLNAQYIKWTTSENQFHLFFFTNNNE